MPITWKGITPDLKSRIRQGGDPMAGFFQDWYVDGTNGNDDGYDGKGWDAPKKTITEVLTAMDLDSGDGYAWIKPPRIHIAPGDYDEGAVLDMDVANMQIIGSLTSIYNHNTMLYSSSASHDLVEIGAHNVRIADIGLVQTKAYDAIQLGDAASEGWWKIVIEGCKFDGWGTCTYGIRAYDATVDCPDMTIRGNLFRSIATTNILMNHTRGMVCDNIIFVDADAIGIDYQQTGGNRPDHFCVNNFIIGSNSGDTGIKIASTEPTDGTLLAALNTVTNCATNITQDKSDAGVVNNWTSGNGASPLIVDAQSG